MLNTHRNHSCIAPLEGTDGPRRALFVKRWGTLLRNPESGFPRFDPELLMPGALDALFKASQAGWWIYLLGNEDDVAHGRVAQETWERFERDLLDHLSKHGVRVTRCYTSIDDPSEGVEGHRKESVYRLPNTGALYHAHQSEGIELKSSWVLGNETLELAAGWRAGCRTAGILGDRDSITGPLETDTAFIAQDLRDAIEALVIALRAA